MNFKVIDGYQLTCRPDEAFSLEFSQPFFAWSSSGAGCCLRRIEIWIQGRLKLIHARTSWERQSMRWLWAAKAFLRMNQAGSFWWLGSACMCCCNTQKLKAVEDSSRSLKLLEVLLSGIFRKSFPKTFKWRFHLDPLHHQSAHLSKPPKCSTKHSIAAVDLSFHFFVTQYVNIWRVWFFSSTRSHLRSCFITAALPRREKSRVRYEKPCETINSWASPPKKCDESSALHEKVLLFFSSSREQLILTCLLNALHFKAPNSWYSHHLHAPLALACCFRWKRGEEICLEDPKGRMTHFRFHLGREELFLALLTTTLSLLSAFSVEEVSHFNYFSVFLFCFPTKLLLSARKKNERKEKKKLQAPKEGKQEGKSLASAYGQRTKAKKI